MQVLSVADREALLSDILHQAIAAIGRYRIYADPSATGSVNCRWCIDYLSPGYEILYGYTPEELMANSHLWGSQIHPEDWQTCILPNLALICSVQGTESRTIATEYRIYHKDGSLRWISENLTVRCDETTHCWTVTSLAVEITERKRTEILLELQNRILAQLAKGEPLPQILDSLMIAIETQLSGALCSTLLLDSDGKLRHVSVPHLPKAYIQAIDGILPEEGAGSCGTAVARRERVIVPDIASDFLWQDYKNVALEHGLRACWAIPILTPEGGVLGAFGVYYREPRSPQSADLEVMTVATNIAEIAISRCQFEMALRESEAKSRAIVATIPDLMFRASRDGTYLEYFTYHRSFDILPTHVNPTGRRIADFVPPEMMQRKMAAIERTLKTQTLQVYEQHIQVGDRLRYEEVRVAPTGTDEVLFMIRDVSERKQAEADRKQAEQKLRTLIEQLEQLNDELEAKVAARTIELRDSEERFRSMYEQSPLGISITDLEGRLIRINPSLSQITGYSEAELLGQHYLDLVHPDDRPEATQLFQQILWGFPQQGVSEKRYLTKTGDEVWVSVTRATIRDRQGQPAYIIGMVQDIRDRKRLEAERHQVQLEMQAQKEFLQRVIDSVPSCIFVKDAEGYIQVANQATADLYGTTVAETLGRRVSDFNSHLSPAQRAIFNLEDQTVVQTGQPLIKQDYIVNRERQTRWYQTTLKPFIDRQGQVQGLVGNSVDITDRKLAELALQQSEETLRLVVQNMPVMLDAYDADGNLIAWNRECERVTGFTADEIINNPNALEMLYPDSDYRIQMQAKCAEHGNDFRDWEWEITCKDGTRKIILWSNVSAEFPIPGWAGWAVGIDISDRKRIETALQESEVRYRRIVETAGEGVWVIDANHQTVFVNDRMAELMGTTTRAMLGRTLFDFMDEEGRYLAETYLARRQQGIAEQHDFKFKRLDGSDLWVIVETTPIVDADGHYQGALAMMTDITDRKQIENQLHNLSDRLSLAIKSGAIGIWDWDLVEDVLVWDDRMCELFGVSRSEFTGSSQTWLQAIHPDDRATTLASTEQALRGEKDYDTEFRVIHPDGSIRFIKAYGLVQRNEAGEPVRMIGINLDISDRKQAEAKLREANQTLAIANAELARANRLKDEFLANMSHELRTPLNAVLGLSQVLQEEAFGSLNDRQRQFVENILSSGNHLLSLINDILDLAKIESGKFDLERSPTSIPTLCETSLNLIRQQAQQKHITLESTIPPATELILLDERRVRQVLINLLSNGVKFTAEGGRVTLRVKIEDGQPSSHWLRFEVEDTGIGIAASDRHKLFQPFVQIDSSLSRRYEGTGLGLVLVKQIVELHGGQVSVTSKLGQGSCFTVRIPYQSLPHPSTPLPTHPPIHPPLILLAEDNQDTQQLLQDYLQLNGFRVILAQNGVEALQIAQEHLPQMILMDIQMPDMDGLEAIQRLKADPKTTMIPVIAVTASVRRGDRERCLAAGASDYLSKPIQLPQLVTKLNDWLPSQLNGAREPL